MASLKALFSAAVLATSAFAAPALEARQSSSHFFLIAIHSTAPFHNQAVNAVGTNFYIGLNATSSCTVPPQDCPNGPATETIFTANPATGTLGLAGEVPGGQQVYIEKFGAMKFTPAHSSFDPNNGVADKFQYAPGTPYGSLTTSALGADFLFSACPVAGQNNVWQVYAYARDGEKPGCVFFKGLTLPYDGPVDFQYD